MKKTDMIRRKLLQNQDIKEAVRHINTDAEFREIAAALVRDDEMAAEPTAEVDAAAPYYQDPVFEAAMRVALAKALREHMHRDAIPSTQSPSTPTLPLLFRGPRVQSSIDVYLNDHGTPSGRLNIGGHAFALKFRSFDVALAYQFTTSTRPWRDMLVEGMSKRYRGDKVSQPDDYNARACFSSLHDASDTRGESAAVVGNVILWAEWDGHQLSELKVIREQDVFHAKIADYVGAKWAGYKCSTF